MQLPLIRSTMWVSESVVLMPAFCNQHLVSWGPIFEKSYDEFMIIISKLWRTYDNANFRKILSHFYYLKLWQSYDHKFTIFCDDPVTKLWCICDDFWSPYDHLQKSGPASCSKCSMVSDDEATFYGPQAFVKLGKFKTCIQYNIRRLCTVTYQQLTDLLNLLHVVSDLDR